MKLEHKIGIAITCTFLCLTGAVIGLKMQQDQSAPTATEQVASSSKDDDPTQGMGRNLFVPGVGGNEPSETPSSPGGRKAEPRDGSKNQKDLAATKHPEKTELSVSPPGDLLISGSGNRPLIQTPPAPATPVDPATDPTRKKDPPLAGQGFGGSNSGSATHAIKQSNAAERISQPVAPEPENKQASSERPIMVGNGEQSISPSAASPSSDRGNQKAGGSVTGDIQASAPGQGKKDATSEEKEKKQDQTTLNNSKQEPLPNGSPASFLTGGSPTNRSPKAPPAPATPPTRSIIPVGDFDGSQPAPPSLSGPPLLETEKDKSPIPPSSSTAGGAGTSTSPPPNRSLDSGKASGNKDGTSGQGNLSPIAPKPPDPTASEGKPTPSPMPSGAKGNDDRSTGSPPPPPPSLMMDKPLDNKMAPAPAPPAPASPPAPANKPAGDSYYIPDPHSTTGSGGNSTAGSGGRSTAAPPDLLPYPPMPGSSPPPSSSSGSERVKPVAPGGAAAAPLTVARPQPQVIVYDEQEYRAAAGDTFDKISVKYYGTPAFAEALKRHNRHHARASVQMTNEGTLAPGERLYIPPADILEQRYGDTIVKPASPSQAVPASFNFPSGSSGK